MKKFLSFDKLLIVYYFLLTVLVCECLFISWLIVTGVPPILNGENKCAVIVVDGEEFRRVKLSEPTDIIFDGVHIEVKRGGISFCASDCEDKNCVKGGRIRQVGSTLACLPKKIVVQVVKIE